MNSPAPTPLWQDVSMPRYEPSRTAWLLTCVDLTSLLVGFFVLLFSTQTLQQEKWKELTGSFQAQFAPRATVVAAVPDGGDNAVIRVTGVKSGVAYLDTLLHQRVQEDPVWADMHAEPTGHVGEDLRYNLSAAVLDASRSEVAEAWSRLGGAMRGWRNTVGVRITVPAKDVPEAAKQAVILADKLTAGGVNGVFAEVSVADGVPRYELVVRAQ